MVTKSSVQLEEFVHESDAYFERNKATLPKKTDDRALLYFQRYGLNASDKILDIGCFTGFHLEWIREQYGCECHGIEPSKKAIEFGRKCYPQLHLDVGFAHKLDRYDDNAFDVVMIRGTFCLVGRELLFETVAQIDRVLKENGRLIIEDFDPPSVQRTQWRHLPGKEVYCYKQPYWDMFTASRLYSLTYAEQGLLDPQEGPTLRNQFKLAVLTKKLFDGYPVV